MKIGDHRRAAREAEAQAKADAETRPLAAANGGSELAERINAEHSACVEASRTALEHAIRCGELLIEARWMVAEKKSSWMTWVKENFRGSKSTEENYRKLASNKRYLTELDSQRAANLSIRDALALLVPEREESDSEEGEGRGSPAAAKKPTQRTGKPRGSSCRKKAEPPATEVYLGEDLPVGAQASAEALGERRAVALSCDLYAGADAEERLAQLQEYLDTVARAALDAEGEAHVLILFAQDPEDRAAAERPLGYDAEKETEERRRYERGVLRGADEVELTLYQAVMAFGGVKPSPAEEYDKVPLCYLAADGLPGDEMADQLASDYPHFGITDEDSLLAALGRAGRWLKG